MTVDIFELRDDGQHKVGTLGMEDGGSWVISDYFTPEDERLLEEIADESGEPSEEAMRAIERDYSGAYLRAQFNE